MTNANALTTLIKLFLIVFSAGDNAHAMREFKKFALFYVRMMPREYRDSVLVGRPHAPYESVLEYKHKGVRISVVEECYVLDREQVRIEMYGLYSICFSGMEGDYTLSINGNQVYSSYVY